MGSLEVTARERRTLSGHARYGSQVEGMVKRILSAMVLLLLAVPVLNASHTARSNGFQPATITSVQMQEVTEPPYSGGDNPSDAPLQSQYYAYNVGVKTACATYVTRYESPYDYLPEAFRANHQMPMRVEKRALDFDLGYREMQMNIIRHKTDKDANCK